MGGKVVPTSPAGRNNGRASWRFLCFLFWEFPRCRVFSSSLHPVLLLNFFSQLSLRVTGTVLSWRLCRDFVGNHFSSNHRTCRLHFLAHRSSLAVLHFSFLFSNSTSAPVWVQ